MAEELTLTLKIDKTTDIRVDIKDAEQEEKVIKTSNSCKTREMLLKSLLVGAPWHYYRFLCLTNDRLIIIKAEYDKSRRSWEASREIAFDLPIKDLVSAYTEKVKGKDWLLINYMLRGRSRQDKFPVENPGEWVNEISSVIEKKKA